MHSRFAGLAVCAVLVAACGGDEPETDPITGRVTAFDGTPIAELPVQADSASGGARAVTGADGQFTIEVPPDGSYLVWVNADDWPQLIVPGIRSGQTGVELQMPETLSVMGVLVDDEGAPLGGRALMLHNPAGETTGPLGQRAASRGGLAITSADGAFRIDGLLPGPHVTDVQVHLPLDAQQQFRCTTELVEAGTEDVRLVATLDAIVSGVVLDPTGQPAANAELHVGRRVIRIADAPALHVGMVGTVADAQGRFTLTGLPPGPVELQVNGAEWTHATLTVDAPAQDVEIRLAPPVLPLTKGSIVAADGSPLAAAPLRFTHETRLELQFFSGTEADGEFTAPHLRDGRYVVEILETHGNWHGPATEVGVIEAGTTGTVLQLAE